MNLCLTGRLIVTKRDDFKAATKTALARRAAHFCSNPRCLKLTIGPHSDPTKALTSGHAAHIHAASELGPRYKASQTAVERTAIETACGFAGSVESSSMATRMLTKRTCSESGRLTTKPWYYRVVEVKSLANAADCDPAGVFSVRRCDWANKKTPRSLAGPRSGERKRQMQTGPFAGPMPPQPSRRRDSARSIHSLVCLPTYSWHAMIF